MSGGAAAQARVMLVLTMVFWGANAVAGKLAVGEISPLLLTWSRWTIAAGVLLILARRHLVHDWPVIRRRPCYLMLMGGLGFTLFNGLLYYGLATTTAINATIIQAAIPMVIFAMNFVLYRTGIRLLQVLGYSLTLLGVAVTAGRGDLASLAGLDLAQGDLLIMLASIIYAAYSVALRRKPAVHWLSFLTVLVTVGAVVSIPFVLLEALAGELVWPRTGLAWGIIAYTAIFPSIIAQAFFIRGTEVLGSNAAGLFLNLMPVTGALLSILLLGERFQLFHAAAMALVLGGITLAQRRQPPA